MCVGGWGPSVEHSVGWRGIYREEEEEARTARHMEGGVGRERQADKCGEGSRVTHMQAL